MNYAIFANVIRDDKTASIQLATGCREHNRVLCVAHQLQLGRFKYLDSQRALSQIGQNGEMKDEEKKKLNSAERPRDKKQNATEWL